MNFVVRPRRLILATIVMASVAMYRPLVLWSQNPWDLAAPQELFLYSAVAVVVQLAIFLVLVALGVQELATVVAVAGTSLVILFWNRTPLLPPWGWLLLLVISAAMLHARARARWLGVIATVTAAVLTIAPSLQVAIAHVQSAAEYPIVELAPRRAANATGAVEDVLVVVVDSYPSGPIARDWFEHDPEILLSRFRAKGLTTLAAGWSHHTFTHLAIPSLLELQPIVEPDIGNSWGNRRSTYRLIRGDNLVATTLQSAGFRYTHIESGWDGGQCGHNVDDCAVAPWFSETTWLLLSPSAVAPWLLSRYGNTSVPGTKHTVSSLLELEHRFDDGAKDYVFAHLLLPHAPIVVNEKCEVDQHLTEAAGVLDPMESEPESRLAFGPQMECVDTLLSQAIDVTGNRTAVLITGDHGPGSNGQIPKLPTEWSDSDIAERLGVLLAYKLPSGCRQPETDSNIEAMRSIMACAVDMDLPAYNGRYVLGASSPVFVEPSRMDKIKVLVTRGELGPSYRPMTFAADRIITASWSSRSDP
jgi:hypothetical protein